MIFKGTQKYANSVHIEIGGRCISQVWETEFLGVTIDDKLTWNCHIENIYRKISKSVAMIYKLKSFVNGKTLLDLYYSMIHTYLTYCNIVLGTAYKTHLNPLIVLQNRVMRAISQSSPHSIDTGLLHLDLNIIRFAHFNEYLTGGFMVKLQNAFYPVYLVIILSTTPPFTVMKRECVTDYMFQRYNKTRARVTRARVLSYRWNM